MAIIKSAVKIIIRESVTYNFSGPALSLGVPEIYATYDELEKWFPKLTGQACRLKSTDSKLTLNEIGHKLGWVTSGTFFKSLGISEVTTMDIPGCEHVPDLIHDLNRPLPQNFINRFNLVIDPGTTEHVFDIKTGLTNIVRALKIGGTIIQQVPVYSYNGGYYSINPNVLNDFYRENGFAEVKTFIIMWDRYHAYTGKHRCYEYNDKLFSGRHALADYDQCRFSPHMLFIARKTEDLSEVRIPLQYEGHYVEHQVNGLSKTDPNLLTRIKRRVFSLSQNALPFPLVFYLTSWLTRNIQWFRTRRKSFWI
jgi:hypothetical protein